MKRKLQTVERELEETSDKMIDTHPTSELYISNLNEENDRLIGENLKLMSEVEKQRREVERKEEEI